MRNPGTLMGVAEDGSFAGSLSGGCIENAVVSEALDALKSGQPRVVRFGTGSPYLDIKLPCGGGLDIHFHPDPSQVFITNGLAAHNGRLAFTIRTGGQDLEIVEGWSPVGFDPQTGVGTFGYWPTPRIQIIGHGSGVSALARLARRMSVEVGVRTPDDRIIAELSDEFAQVERLHRIDEVEFIESDPWTAFVFLFHDHDWEIELMAYALGLPNFYLGAMGGRKAHAMRCEALSAKGISDEQLATIRAPIGVFHSSRDPQTLALSTLAQIIRTYQETDFEAALG